VKDQQQAARALSRAWPHIVEETGLVLGSELHYQAMVYHGLRIHGPVPATQIGMNAKMWITDPVSDLFRKLDLRKHEDYRGAFEPVTDVCLFAEGIAADWRRRNYEKTLTSLLLAIEVKASERAGGRLRAGEIVRDIDKLAAHCEEARHRGGLFIPVMMVIDTAPEEEERMTPWALSACHEAARKENVEFLYVSQDKQLCTLDRA
jgi:hypothetical protein